MKTSVKNDKGVAGLTILLSLVTMLFVIGLLVTIFSLMGGEMRDATYTSTAVDIENETITGLAVAGDDFSVVDYQDVVCTDGVVWNMSDDTVILATGNYTIADCNIVGILASPFLTFDVGVNYTYTYGADNTATNVMNDTTVGISSVTDWFPIFVVIGAMVVLILLTVIIISSIRGSGLMGGATA